MKKMKSNPFLVLLQWAGKSKYYLYLSIALSFISGICTVVPFYSIYKVMALVYQGNAYRQAVAVYCLAAALAVGGRFLLFGISGIVSHKGAYQALFKVRCMVTEHLGRIPLGSLSEHNTGQIKTTMNESIEKLELFLAHNLPELVYYLTGPVVIFIYLLTVNVPMALVSLVPLIAALGIMFVIYTGMGKMMDEVTGSVANLNAVLVEYISGMRQIKAYHMGAHSFTRYKNAIEEENKIWCRVSRKTGPPYAVFVLLIESGMLLLVPLGGHLFLKGSLSVSAFLLFAFIGSVYLSEIRPLQEVGNKMAEVMKGVGQVEEILDIPIYEEREGIMFPTRHDIVLNQVSFSYHQNKEVLKDCDLNIAAGEKLAVIGPSGAGKTTLALLIARFYNVSKGSISIGGCDIRSLNYEEILKHVSIVFQKTFLTRDSVLENIRMGSEASLEEVRSAARLAQIDEFIESLPEGYDTKVGSFGSRFSGGERQRIAIARAILKNSPILILDEATSAADPENQVEIDKAIVNLCEGKTVVIIAHRLGVVKMCDRIAIVENGRIIGSGTHQEVLERSSYYQKVWKNYQDSRMIIYGRKGE